MPINVTKRDRKGQLYQTPFIDRPERVVQAEIDLSAFVGSGLIDESGTLKPGSPLSYTENTLAPVGSASALEITSVSTEDNTITVGGDQTGRVQAGDSVSVEGSTGNDGNYTVVETAYNDGDDATVLSVSEDLDDGTADGEVVLGDGGDALYGVVPYAQKVAESNAAEDLTRAGENPEATCATAGLLNGAEVVVQIGRDLTPAEESAFAANGAFTLAR